MKKIIFPILGAMLFLTSCEDKERLAEIKAELKGSDDQGSCEVDKADVTISAPSQNIVATPAPLESSPDYSTGFTDEPSYNEPSDFDRYEEDSEY